MSRAGDLGSVSYESFPRVSGDEPLEATFGPKIEGFSPRERG